VHRIVRFPLHLPQYCSDGVKVVMYGQCRTGGHRFYSYFVSSGPSQAGPRPKRSKSLKVSLPRNNLPRNNWYRRWSKARCGGETGYISTGASAKWCGRTVDQKRTRSAKRMGATLTGWWPLTINLFPWSRGEEKTSAYKRYWPIPARSAKRSRDSGKIPRRNAECSRSFRRRSGTNTQAMTEIWLS